MGTQLYFSHDSERLAERLAVDLIAAARTAADPFVPLTILVPNAGIKRWLQIELSEALGVAANLEFRTLERGLGDLLIPRHRGPASIDVLHGDRLRLFVLASIMESLGGDDALGDALEALAFMLYDEDGKPSRNFAGKLWRIAGQLARVLTEYELHRSDMIAGWTETPPKFSLSGTNSEAAEMERCQMALYRHIFGRGGVRDRYAEASGERLLTLPQLAAGCDLESVIGTPIFGFGLSQISVFHRDLLFRLGRGFDLHLYQLNVCSEFWEDVTSSREDKWRRLKALEPVVNDDGGMELPWDEDENMLLKWWGKPGRESIRLLSDLETMAAADMTLETTWLDAPEPDPAGSTLSALRHQVLHRTQTGDPRLPQDRSIQVFGAPGIFREVEAIHQSILKTMTDAPDLKQTDIAILVPDMTTYKPAIGTIFGRGDKPLGYNLTDANAANESLYGTALTLLLELPSREFTRKSVFELVKNPCFMAAAGLSRDDVRAWADWADRLGIFRGFHSGRGGNERYTWAQGLKRLRLGRIMRDPATTNQPPHHFCDLVPHHDIESSDVAAVGAFSLAVERIHGAVSQLSGGKRSVANWRRLLESLADSLFGVPDGHPEEASVRSKVFADLAKLDALDMICTDDEATIDLDLFRELVASSLEGIPGRHGSFLSSGVTIAQIKPNRVVPFEVVYLAGMGEGQFPRRAERSSLDLRQTARRLGDVSAPEEDRFSVLETLMSCRQKLYLSFVSRDLQKDQDFYPCSIIVQLVHFLETSVVDGLYRMATIPVGGDDDQYLLHGDDPWDVMATVAENDRYLCLKRVAEEDADRLSASDLDRVRTWLAEHDGERARMPMPDTENGESGTTGLYITDLSAYLDNPLEASLHKRLGVNQWRLFDEEPSMTEDEPFYSENSVTRDLILTVLNAAVDQSIESGVESVDEPAFEALFDALYDDRHRRSATPEGIYSLIDRADVLDRAKTIFLGGRKASLRDVLVGLDECEALGTVALGDGRADIDLGPCAIPLGDGRTVDLRGNLRRVWFDRGEGRLHLLHLTGDRGDHFDFPLHPKLLSSFIGYLALLTRAATGDDIPFSADNLTATVHWTNLKGTQTVTYSPTLETAQEYLVQLCADALDRPFDMIPYAVAARLAKANTEIPIPLRPGSYAEVADKANYLRRFDREIREQMDNAWSNWYPSPLLKLLNYTVPDDAWDLINRRLSLFHAYSR